MTRGGELSLSEWPFPAPFFDPVNVKWVIFALIMVILRVGFIINFAFSKHPLE